MPRRSTSPVPLPSTRRSRLSPTRRRGGGGGGLSPTRSPTRVSSDNGGSDNEMRTFRRLRRQVARGAGGRPDLSPHRTSGPVANTSAIERSIRTRELLIDMMESNKNLAVGDALATAVTTSRSLTPTRTQSLMKQSGERLSKGSGGFGGGGGRDPPLVTPSSKSRCTLAPVSEKEKKTPPTHHAGAMSKLAPPPRAYQLGGGRRGNNNNNNNNNSRSNNAPNPASTISEDLMSSEEFSVWLSKQEDDPALSTSQVSEAPRRGLDDRMSSRHFLRWLSAQKLDAQHQEEQPQDTIAPDDVPLADPRLKPEDRMSSEQFRVWLATECSDV